MVLLFLISGLLIGFTLGFQDVYLLLGARIRHDRSIALLALFVSIALIVGALSNLNGTTVFVSTLAGTNQIQVAFLILFSALITITLLRLKFRIISISHAIIGSIAGWLLFVDNDFPGEKFISIVIIWVLTPILAGILSASYLTIIKIIAHKLKLHILIISRVLQFLLFIVLLLGAYSIGANNIANVVGPYLDSFSGEVINVFGQEVKSSVVLVGFGSLSIAAGLFSRILLKSKKQDLEIFEFSSESNFSVLLAFASIFFLFSSTFIHNLIGYIGFSYPLVPLSALHILTAGIVGVSYKKGFNIYQKDAFAGLAIGSILTPVLSGLIMFSSALVLKALWGDVNTKMDIVINETNEGALNQFLIINDSSNFYNLGIVIFLSSILLIGIIVYSQMQKKYKQEKDVFTNNRATLEAEKEFFKKELQYSAKQAQELKQELDFKNKELEKFAINLVEKEEILKKVKDILALVKKTEIKSGKKEVVSELSNLMLNNLNLSNEKISFYQNVDDINKDFYIRLSQQFNNLTENDKRLIAFLKLGLSSKEISSLVNISTKSVEMNRYRLRTKLGLLNDQNLLSFVNNI